MVLYVIAESFIVLYGVVCYCRMFLSVVRCCMLFKNVVVWCRGLCSVVHCDAMLENVNNCFWVEMNCVANVLQVLQVSVLECCSY